MADSRKVERPRYRAISVRFWGDARVQTMSRDAQFTFLYLLTCPQMTSLGAMRCTEAGLAAELKYSREAFREAFRQGFPEAFPKPLDKALWEYSDTDGLVVVPNYVRHNPPASPNVVKSWAKQLDTLPECDLLIEQLQRDKAFVEGIGEGFGKAFREAIAIPSLNHYHYHDHYHDHDPPPSPPLGGVECETLLDGLDEPAPAELDEVTHGAVSDERVEVDDYSPDSDRERGTRANPASTTNGWAGPRPRGWTRRLETTFEEFWAAYPRKTAKGAARKAWAKLKPFAVLEDIHKALQWQCLSDNWRKDGGQYIPHPATWLNACGWESTGIDFELLNTGDDDDDHE